MAQKTKTIKASSRAAVKIGDNYYTVEFTEEWSVSPTANIADERAALWDTVNRECDNQVADIYRTLG